MFRLSLCGLVYNFMVLSEEPRPKVGASSKEKARMNSPCSPSSAVACYGGWTSLRGNWGPARRVGSELPSAMSSGRMEPVRASAKNALAPLNPFGAPSAI
jgi:hypothetical protein